MKGPWALDNQASLRRAIQHRQPPKHSNLQGAPALPPIPLVSTTSHMHLCALSSPLAETPFHQCFRLRVRWCHHSHGPPLRVPLTCKYSSCCSRFSEFGTAGRPVSVRLSRSYLLARAGKVVPSTFGLGDGPLASPVRPAAGPHGVQWPVPCSVKVGVCCTAPAALQPLPLPSAHTPLAQVVQMQRGRLCAEDRGGTPAAQPQCSRLWSDDHHHGAERAQSSLSSTASSKRPLPYSQLNGRS
jgi:hypothetical protein